MKPKKVTIKVRVKVSKLIGTMKAREILRKLEIYAKELINENN